MGQAKRKANNKAKAAPTGKKGGSKSAADIESGGPKPVKKRKK